MNYEKLFQKNTKIFSEYSWKERNFSKVITTPQDTN